MHRVAHEIVVNVRPMSLFTHIGGRRIASSQYFAIKPPPPTIHTPFIPIVDSLNPYMERTVVDAHGRGLKTEKRA